MVKNYRSGHNSRIYEINDKILKENIKRYKNSDSVLIKKRRKFIHNNQYFSNSPIKKELREKLIQDLFSVTIDYESSVYFLESFESDKEILKKNLFTIESIKEGDIFYHFDTYGRFHTNFTILKSFLRKNHLRIDGQPTVELDIKNSQPLFLNKLIQKSNDCVDEETMLYAQLTNSGQFYQYLQENLKIKDKSKVKDVVYKIFFGKNYSNQMDKKFKTIFPKIYELIKSHKKINKDYKSISHELQRLESDFIFNKVINFIYEYHPNIKLLTCHDSIICKKEDYDIVSGVFHSYLSREFNFDNTKSLIF
jgi:hypothetical protein